MRYRERDGGLTVRGAKLLRGGRAASLPAPLDELPLLARAGTILPLLAADVDTLAPTGAVDPAEKLVGLGDRRSRLSLLAFPRGRSVSRFNRGERLISRERPGRRTWQLRVAGKRKRSYHLQAALGSLRHPFAPCSIRLDGDPLPRGAWSYSRKRRTLKVIFRTRSGTLKAGACSA